VRTRRVERSEDVVYVEPVVHPLAVTLNPLDLFWGRISTNIEFQLEPHHSILVVPSVLAAHSNRGDPGDLLPRGFGFATTTSNGAGIELGYHYWLHWARVLRGPFLGPSFLLGFTTHPSVGDPNGTEGYWGLAFDAGWQEVIAPGFTAGAGLGVGWLRMSDTATAFPRFLVQVGWSF
jgi:hypothetical protein